MEEWIKKSDAMDAVMWGNGLDGSVVDDICEKIEALPSADRPQGEWIPCSERLPSESGYYLCCNNGYLPYVGHFINGRWSDFDCTIVHADAWMPLPKPYKEK